MKQWEGTFWRDKNVIYIDRAYVIVHIFVKIHRTVHLNRV